MHHALTFNRPISLVGMMGVGKSSIGKRLAHALHIDFVDADHEIVLAAGMSISEIFEKFGEEHFRDGERRVISRLCEGDTPKVIATGGGAFVNAETQKLMLEKSIVVWLDADLDVLVERTGRRNDRPLLASGNPREILARLMKDRQPSYALAHVRVDSVDGPHDVMVDRILKAIKCLKL